MRSLPARNRPAHLLSRWIIAGAVLVSSGALVVGGVTPVASAAGEDRTGAASVSAAPELPDGHTHGRDAIEALGEDLEQVAAERDMSPAKLRDQLKSDDALRVDPDGGLYWADAELVQPESSSDAPKPSGRSARLERGQAAAPRAAQALSAEEAFSLHSNPGAEKVIYLNFRGWTIPADTAYTAIAGLAGTTVAGWGPATDGPGFSAAEVEEAWATVAELFSAFDVDVTTEDPGAAGLVRADLADTSYGVQVVVTPDEDVWAALGYNNGVSVAGFGGVGKVETVLVFPDHGFEWSPVDVGVVSTHEVGHSLGLSHDTITLTFDGATYTENFSGWLQDYGKPGYDFFAPITNWSPIMGGIGTPLVQWSKGEYRGAANTEDDLGIIESTLGVRADEAPSSVAGAADLPDATAYITSESDVDSWLLGTCTADASVRVVPAAASPALDVEASLVRRSDASVVETANPPTFFDWGASGVDFAGMGASLTVADAGTGYVLRVRGGGNGAWDGNGYGAYGSVGQYTIEVDGCDGAAAPGAPGQPADLSATPSGSADSASVELSWTPPVGTVDEYVVAVGGEEFTTTGTGFTVDDLRFATTYAFTVTAVRGNDHGRAAQVAATTPSGVPGAPARLRAAVLPTVPTAKAELDWAAPVFDGGLPILEYQVYLEDGGSLTEHASVPADELLRYYLDSQSGTSVVAVAAVNANGAGAPAYFGAIAWDGAPPAPTMVRAAAAGDGSATVSWSAPLALGPLTSYTVAASPGGATATTADGQTTQVVVSGLQDGEEHTFTVTATNASGTSSASDPSAPVRIGIAPVTTDNVVDQVVHQPVEVTLAAEDESGVAQTRYTIGTKDTPAADPRTDGVVYDDAAKPVLSHGEYLRYSSQDSLGNAEKPRASAVARVAARVTAPVLEAGSNQVGQTVSIVPPEVSPAGAEPTYQWRRRDLPGSGWEQIDGATGTSYQLTPADSGHQIGVTATVAAAGFRPASATSLASVVVVGLSDTSADGFGGPVTDRFRTKSDSDNNSGTGPNDVAVDDDGFVYVPNEGNRRIQKFTAAGDLVDTWGAPPSAKYHTYLSAVAAGGPDGHVYAVDSNNHRVLEYDADGTLVRRWAVPIAHPMLVLRQPAGITVDDEGGVYVSDTPFGVVQKLDRDGTFLWRWDVPDGTEATNDIRGLAVLDDTVYVAGNGRVRALDPDTGALTGSWDGTSGGGEQFDSPADIAIDHEHNFYVLESNGYRIQKFDSDFSFVEEVVAWDGFTATNETGTGLALGVNGQIYVAKNYPDEEIEMIGRDAVRFVPDAPTGVQASPGDGQVTVSWTAPGNANGRQITGYTVTARIIGQSTPAVFETVTGDLRAATVTGLTNDTGYTFTVKATNAAGDSVESASSAMVAPEAGLTDTSIGLVVTGDRIQGSTLTLTATVTPSDAAGIVEFWDGDAMLYSAWPEDGVASFEWQPVAVGSHSLTAKFVPWGPGAGVFLGSLSTPVEVTITPREDPTEPPDPTPAITASGQGFSTPTPKVGVAVSAVRGTWGPSDATVTYRWVSGAQVVSTATSYTPTPADVGKQLTLTITGSKGGYTSKVVTLTSGAVAKGTLTRPKKLAVTGTYAVGKSLKVTSTGSWKPKAKLTYQWFANGKAIKGAKKASLKLTKAQAGKRITVKVAATAAGYHDVVSTLTGKKVKKAKKRK